MTSAKLQIMSSNKALESLFDKADVFGGAVNAIMKVLDRKIKPIIRSTDNFIKFDSPTNTIYELKFMLNCLLLPTDGHRQTLIYRLINNNIFTGEKFYLKGNGIEFIEFDRMKYSVDRDLPMYMLGTLLTMKNLPIGGNRYDLLRRLKNNSDASGETLVLDRCSGHAEIIADVIVKIMVLGEFVHPSAECVYVLDKYGYCYVEALRNFVHRRTREKIYGNTTWADRISLFFHDVSWEETRFTDDECAHKSKTS